jgi:hypothetical protein
MSTTPSNAPMTSIPEIAAEIATANQQWCDLFNTRTQRDPSRYTWNRDDSPTTKFHLRYARHTKFRLKRTQSLSLPSKATWRVQRKRGDQRQRDPLRYVAHGSIVGLSRVGTYVSNKIRSLIRHCLAHPRHKVVTAGLFGLFLYTNGKAAHIKASQTPVTRALGSYKEFPSWMHTHALQVIGLPAQVAPGFIPHMDVVKKSWSKFKGKWHPDRYRHNGFDQATAYAVYHRGEAAYDIVVKILEDPLCQRYLDDVIEFDLAHNYAKQDRLPNFAKDCACTLPKYLLGEVIRFIVPFEWQAEVPEEIEDFCPCDAEMAYRSWDSFSLISPPPYITRIKQSLPWSTPDWRVLLYRLVGIVRNEGIITERTGDAVAHAQSTRMVGWASWREFLYGLKVRPCRKYYHDFSDPTDPTDDYGHMPEEWLVNSDNEDSIYQPVVHEDEEKPRLVLEDDSDEEDVDTGN